MLLVVGYGTEKFCNETWIDELAVGMIFAFVIFVSRTNVDCAPLSSVELIGVPPLVPEPR
jgi:hypothetical protein